MKLLVTFAQRFTPRADEIAIDLNVLAFTFGLSVLTGPRVRSIPAFARRIDVAPALREGTPTSHSSQRVRSVLIVAQISASFMLLIAAGLTLRSLMKVQGVNPGFRTAQVLTFRADMAFDKIPLSMPQPERRAKVAAYWTEFEARVRAIPGVIDAGGAGTFPLNEFGPFNSPLLREFHPLPDGVLPPQIDVRFASADYFKALDQAVIAGRAFRQSDTFTSTPVAIVNQTAAGKFWPNEDPVGTRFVTGPNQFATVVGVVADVRQQLDRAPAAEIYVPLQQFSLFGTTWVVRTEQPVAAVESAIRAAARAHDADLPVTSFRTLDEVRSTTLAPRRVVVALIGLFGLLALVITAAGIAGVVSFSVNQRTQEFGIRMALGAPRARVLSMVIREGAVLAIVGLGIGLAGAVALTRVLGRMLVASNPQADGPLLFDVQPTDALTYSGVALVLLPAALAACLTPARRAASATHGRAARAVSGGFADRRTSDVGSDVGRRTSRRTSGVGRRASGVGRRASGIGLGSGIGRRTSDVGRRASDVGRRASGVGRRASGVGRRASGVGRLAFSWH